MDHKRRISVTPIPRSEGPLSPELDRAEVARSKVLQYLRGAIRPHTPQRLSLTFFQ
jgi:hypothetical protein